MNKVVLMGRLTADPELKVTPNGISVLNFCVASDRDYVDKATGERKADFFDVVAWRQTAEFVSRYFRKGQMILVCGTLETRTYTDNNGTNRKVTEIKADNVYFTGSKGSTGGDNAQVQTSAPAAAAAQNDSYTPYYTADDDLPF